jgi:hypothetical protein
VSSSGSSVFAARDAGATAGVARSGGKQVFASSVAPKGAKSRGKDSSRGSRAGTPSARSAAGDLWRGFGSSTRSGVSAAEASDARGDGGLGSGAVFGIAILSLGLAGALGASGVAASRRRRARAGSGRIGM